LGVAAASPDSRFIGRALRQLLPDERADSVGLPNPVLRRLAMCRGEWELGLAGYKPQCGIAGKETQQDGPLATERCQLHEAIWGRSVLEQLAVLDVYVSQSCPQRISVHGIPSSRRRWATASQARKRHRLCRGSAPQIGESRRGSFTPKRPQNASSGEYRRHPLESL